jgi:hypothetical protein
MDRSSCIFLTKHCSKSTCPSCKSWKLLCYEACQVEAIVPVSLLMWEFWMSRLYIFGLDELWICKPLKSSLHQCWGKYTVYHILAQYGIDIKISQKHLIPEWYRCWQNVNFISCYCMSVSKFMTSDNGLHLNGEETNTSKHWT